MHRQLIITAALLAGLSAGAGAQDFANATLETVKVADGIHMLMGPGGNIGVSSGADGVLIIDDQFAPLAEKVADAVEAIAGEPVRMVLNTHWHGDHTGGNEHFGKAGALIVAHDNVRTRMSASHFSAFFNMESPPSPPAALPVVTFDSNVTLHLNGQTIRAEHVAPAHTDGDAIIWFDEGDVVHMGDVFFNGLYPFIDYSSGGSIEGMMAAIDATLPRLKASTRIMPGHGPLSDRDGLQAFRNMLGTVAGRIRAQLDEGRSIDDIVASKPTAEYDETWGTGFIKPDDWVRLNADGMQAQ